MRIERPRFDTDIYILYGLSWNPRYEHHVPYPPIQSAPSAALDGWIYGAQSGGPDQSIRILVYIVEFIKKFGLCQRSRGIKWNEIIARYAPT